MDARALTDKGSRIELKQIMFYIELLKHSGTRIGDNITKHIDGGIWELRPGNNRIFFFGWKGDKLVLLHHFKKKTNKTPQQEVEKAKREYGDWITRYGT